MTDTDRAARFVQFCHELGKKQKVGRPALRRTWAALRQLYEREIQPRITEAEVQRLLGKRFSQLDPEENDLKALASLAVGKGWILPDKLRDALAEDIGGSPLAFLAGLSGKAFGETVAPQLCRFWLASEDDGWDKRPATDYYDIGWTPSETGALIRLELKASSESPAFRFQQVRDPRSAGQSTSTYDALVCMGVTVSTVEFWVVPSTLACEFIDDGTFSRQHGGKKQGLESGTYWFVTDPATRALLAERGCTASGEELRPLAVQL